MKNGTKAIKWKRITDQFSGSSVWSTISVIKYPCYLPKNKISQQLKMDLVNLKILLHVRWSPPVRTAWYVFHNALSHLKHTVQPYWDICRHGHANFATLEWPINDIKHSTQEVGHLSGLSQQQKMSKYQHIAVTAEVRFFGYASSAKRLMHSGLAFCGICTSFSDSG